VSKTLLNPEQAAAILGVTRPGFVKMYKRGDIEAEIIVGRQAFFTPQAVAGLKRNRAKSGNGENGSRPKKKR